MTYLPEVDSARITDGTIVNADISGSAAIAYSKLSLSTSIVTGDLASSVTLDAIATANATAAAVSMNSNKITNVTDPTAAQDAATKAYVDSAVGDPPTLTVTAEKTAAYTMLDGDDVIRVDTATTGAFTVTLLAAATAGSGYVVHVVDTVGNCGTATCTIDGNASETINGAATLALDQDRGSYTLVCDGSNWFVI